MKILAELKQKGEVIETVAAEIVAGDAGDLNVISMKGNNKTYKFVMMGSFDFLPANLRRRIFVFPNSFN